MLLKGQGATLDKQIDIAATLMARDYKGFGNQSMNGVIEEQRRLGNLYGDDRGTGFAGNVWDKNYISPSLNTMQGGDERTDDC